MQRAWFQYKYLRVIVFGFVFHLADFSVQIPAESLWQGIVPVLPYSVHSIVHGWTSCFHNQPLLDGGVIGARLLVTVLARNVRFLHRRNGRGFLNCPIPSSITRRLLFATVFLDVNDVFGVHVLIHCNVLPRVAPELQVRMVSISVRTLKMWNTRRV